MLQTLLVIFIVFYLILFVLNLFERSVVQQVHIAIMFFIIALSCLMVQIPYTAILSTDTIVSGQYVVADYSASAFFSLMAIVQVLLAVFYSNEAKKKKRMGLD